MFRKCMRGFVVRMVLKRKKWLLREGMGNVKRKWDERGGKM